MRCKQVDGQPVHGSALAELRAKILGEIGTFVTLRFSREGDDGEMYSYTVPAPFPLSLSHTHTHTHPGRGREQRRCMVYCLGCMV